MPLALASGPQRPEVQPLVFLWLQQKTKGHGGAALLMRLCFLCSDGHKSSKATPSKKLGKQGSLLLPTSLHIQLTPPTQEVGVQCLSSQQGRGPPALRWPGQQQSFQKEDCP